MENEAILKLEELLKSKYKNCYFENKKTGNLKVKTKHYSLNV